MLDLVLRNATIMDGTGSAGYIGDLGISGGKIAALGNVAESGAQEIDCTGKIVCPGFVDVHTHYDAQVFWDPNLTPSVNHGVTTVIAGNCGFTLAPLSGKAEDLDYLIRMLSRVEGMPIETLRSALKPNWRSFGEFLDTIDGKTAINAVFLVGHSALRRLVMGEDAVRREATEEEIERMCELLDKSLSEGGAGFSTSISSTHSDYEGEPVPSRWASHDELFRLARVLRNHPGTWGEFVHGDILPPAEIREFGTRFSIEAQRPINWNLISVTKSRQAKVEEQLAAGDHARQRGGIVWGLTPSVGPTPILNFVSGFLLDGIPNWSDVILRSNEEKVRLLADPNVRAKLREGYARNSGPAAHLFADWSKMIIQSLEGPGLEKWVGRTLGEYAAEAGIDPLDALFDLAVASNLNFTFTPGAQGDDDESWRLRGETWRDPRVLIGGSDAGAHLDMLDTFAFSTQLLGRGVRQRSLIPFEEAIYRITGKLAEAFGIKERGVLAPGKMADVVVFDPATIDCGPCVLRDDLPMNGRRITADAVGVEHVIVNGVPVIADGEFTGRKGGRILRSGKDTETVPLPEPVAA